MNPLVTKNFNTIANIARDVVQKFYEDTTELPPMGMVFTEREDSSWDIGLVDLRDFFWRENKQSAAAVALMNEFLKDPAVYCTCLVNEAWMVERKPSDLPLTQQPSASPDRKEYLILNMLTAHNQGVYMMPINRSVEGITTLGEGQFLSGNDGSLVGDMVRN